MDFEDVRKLFLAVFAADGLLDPEWLGLLELLTAPVDPSDD